jgi:hypothetical protein
MHKQKLLDYVTGLCVEQGTERPERLARQVLILIDGAITLALVMGDHDAADQAQDVLKTLLAVE